VIGSSIAPIVGRLSDLYGRLPFYYFGLTINICSALYLLQSLQHWCLRLLLVLQYSTAHDEFCQQ
jgi:MFS family permease